MWWFNRIFRHFILLIVSLALLAGCTFRPLYQAGETANFAISYPSPGTVTEQTLIEELKFRLGSASEGKYELKLASTTSTRGVYHVPSTFRRAETEATLRVNFELIEISSETVLVKDSRFATALYQGSTQNIANRQALEDAYKRAAKDVAREITLIITNAIQRHER